MHKQIGYDVTYENMDLQMKCTTLHFIQYYLGAAVAHWLKLGARESLWQVVGLNQREPQLDT